MGTKLNLTANDRRVNADIEALKALGRGTVEMRRKASGGAYSKGEDRKDLLDFLLEYNEKNKEEALTDDEIIDTFTTLFLAGMDTTGHLLNMAVYYLIKYPHYLTRIQEEVAANGVDLDNISIDVLNKLKFLDAFLKEVLRWGTPGMRLFPREATTTHQLGDLKILKGTVVNVEVNAIGFNPLYFDQPYEFRPERFLEEKDEKKTRNPFAYIPFSAGSRNCIGKYLAMIEAKSILLSFVKRFSFKFTNPDYKLRMTLRFLYEPAEPIQLDLQPLAK
eukprot:TRINITY_DN5642_c0_g1_i5.p1 TRINITY_DN5642_c0_g1~~TRINITY_DN5642_c0_g1_i5.p1  ORF type:complete len:276 (-),score=89.47 TRINITY_DN5642_c0_g1_i5:93-920(-)